MGATPARQLPTSRQGHVELAAVGAVQPARRGLARWILIGVLRLLANDKDPEDPVAAD